MKSIFKKSSCSFFILLFSLAINYSCSKKSEIEELITEPIEEPVIDILVGSKKVLFIGNSFTYGNNMPELVKQLALSVQDTLAYRTHTISGSNIHQHANSSELEEKINSHDWDFVTIQTQSIESALSENYFNTNVYPNAVTLVEKIKNNSSKSIPLFFMTWGYLNGVESYCEELPYMCNFESMNDKLEERYTYFAKSTNSNVSPCGLVWKSIRKIYPDLNLYESDGSHPSRIGSYIAACTFYTMIYKKDPSLLTYDDPAIDDTHETIIKQQVKQLVYNYIDDWQFN